MFKKYRKKLIVVSAMQWLGDYDESSYCLDDYVANHQIGFYTRGNDVYYLEIRTLEGVTTADIGDWIIIGVNGELYPCKDDIFKKTYEEV